MAKIVKIPLVMKNGEKATDMKSLKENFDAESVVGYFLDGKLTKWLNDRYYEDEAEAIAELSGEDPELTKKLCAIFGVEYVGGNEVDPEEIAWRNERLARLKQLTDDENILKNVDNVAFDQEELAELYDRGVDKIYLCEGEFKVPKSKRGLDYVLLGDATADGIATETKTEEIPLTMPRALEDIEISEDISLNSSQKKFYKNARVRISRTIHSSGFLSFENCEITCNQNSFRKRNFFSLDGGTLQFKNCRIEYKNPNPDSFADSRFFIGGECARVLFEECEFIGGGGLISSLEGGEITFESCSGKKITSPLIKGEHEKLIRLVNCHFTSCEEPMLPRAMGSAIQNALLDGGDVQISDSTFEGFTEGIVKSKKTVTISNSTFTECAGIVTGDQNDITVESCEFNRCIHPFYAQTLNLLNCKFHECYGKLRAKNMHCENIECHDGFMWFLLHGDSKFLNCTFKNINRQEAMQRLGHSKDNGFHYFLVKECEVKYVFSEVEALIVFRTTGKIIGCKFLNIDTGEVRFIITCGHSTDIERSVFDECVAKEDILDRTGYNDKRSSFADQVNLILSRSEHPQAGYYIKNCEGIS